MSKLQVAEVSVESAFPRLQVSEISVEVPSQGDRVLQVARIAVENMDAAPTLSVSVDVSEAKAGEVVTMTASPAGSWDSVTWVQQPGDPMVLLSGSELEKSFVAPALPHEAQLRWAVTVEGPTGDATKFVAVRVVPHLTWVLVNGQWTATWETVVG